MNQENSIIVISRYKKNVNWTRKFIENGFRVLVYDHQKKEDNPYYVKENKGREASVYLKYIIDYYDYLTPYTIFLQDEDKSWHHQGSLVQNVLDYMYTSGKSDKFYNFNNRCLARIKSNNLYPMMKDYFQKFLEPYIGNIEKYGNWTVGYKCCAQFIVHRDYIHKYPHEMYQNMYKYMMNDKHDEKAKGHMFEWTLHLLYDNPFTIHKMKKEEYDKIMQERITKLENAIDNEEKVKIDGCRLIVSY